MNAEQGNDSANTLQQLDEIEGRTTPLFTPNSICDATLSNTTKCIKKNVDVCAKENEGNTSVD
jgi:hypothetical protein